MFQEESFNVPRAWKWLSLFPVSEFSILCYGKKFFLSEALSEMSSFIRFPEIVSPRSGGERLLVEQYCGNSSNTQNANFHAA